MKLGVVLENLGLPVRAALLEAAKLGIAGVQLDAAAELDPTRLGDSARREVRTLLRSFNLEPAAVNCPMRRGLDTFEHQQARIEYVQRAMQFAADVGSKIVIVPLPKLPDAEPVKEEETAGPKPFLFFKGPPPRGDTLRESLLALSRSADRLGITLALEAGLDPAAKVAEYLGGFETGALQVNFDPANFFINGHDPIASVFALNGRIPHTHARDALRTSAASGPEEVPLGAGDIDWLSYVGTLAATDYRGYLTVERTQGQQKLADLAAGVKFLRKMIPQTA
jgi:sugar phosphate isomerase/epimerase